MKDCDNRTLANTKKTGSVTSHRPTSPSTSGEEIQTRRNVKTRPHNDRGP